MLHKAPQGQSHKHQQEEQVKVQAVTGGITIPSQQTSNDKKNQIIQWRS